MDEQGYLGMGNTIALPSQLLKLDARGFYDFAGSTLVHSVGGWGALVGAWMLGPRIGKYSKAGMTPIPGSNMPLATIGVLILWLGWFGFNGGSVLSADPAATSYTLVTTSLAAAAGGIGAMVAYTFISRKPDLSMALNGILAGLVGITAGADVITPMMSIVVGFIAGGLVVGSVIFFDKMKIDDPVGAISVHGVVGLLCLLLVPVSNPLTEDGGASFSGQLIGAATIFVWVFVTSFIVWGILKAVIGIRVSEEEEYEGVDMSECGMEAYPEFVGASGSGA